MSIVTQTRKKLPENHFAEQQPARARSVFGLLFTGLLTLRNWRQRARERKQLASLPSYILKDIGLNEADRYRETRKRFWEE